MAANSPIRKQLRDAQGRADLMAAKARADAAAKKKASNKKISPKTVPNIPGTGPLSKIPKPKKPPKFVMPTVAEYRSSAAYRSDDGQTYKQYVLTAKAVYDAKYKKQKGK